VFQGQADIDSRGRGSRIHPQGAVEKRRHLNKLLPSEKPLVRFDFIKKGAKLDAIRVGGKKEGGRGTRTGHPGERHAVFPSPS